MPYLSQINDAMPTDTDFLTAGDDQIRQVRQSMSDTFIVEHWLNGEHRIPYGASANRPAPGSVGRMFIEQGRGIERDYGNTWILASMLSGLGGRQTATVTGTYRFQGYTYNAPVPIGASVLAIAQINWDLKTRPDTEFVTMQFVDLTGFGLPASSQQFHARAIWGLLIAVAPALTVAKNVGVTIDVTVPASTPVDLNLNLVVL